MLDLGLLWCALLCRMHVSFITFVFKSEVRALPYDETVVTITSAFGPFVTIGSKNVCSLRGTFI